ncbi:transmembrane protease serine 2-like [Scomber japonicus]|uniref:transmembrane protease serine 2-like n=1 Tax=Scomber japonicus TaxID=13676 RepID=UPI00230519D9|nr:transmembrane protease serine 2-like [Scomber japonicus]
MIPEYPDPGSFICEDGERRKLPPLSRSDVRPQYVHHLAPKPVPEITDSIPKHKDSSSCMHGRQCGDGSCVWENQWCDGVKDCPAGQDEANCVRLRGSSFLLQIYSSQTKTWRSVCSRGWTDQQGRASCQHIGYSRSTYFKSGQREADSGDGFLMMNSDFNPETSILQQFFPSKTCPNNSVVTLRCTDCGGGVNSSRPSRGQLASLGAWQWQVSLQIAGSHRCGGAIISPYWIVTAAHCAAKASHPGVWTVYAGIVNPLGTLFNPAYSVSHTIIHEGYDSLTRRNDIALMRLSKPVDKTVSTNIGPVCLPNVGLNIVTPQRCWTTWFGRTVNGDSGSLHLMEAQVSLINTSVCNSSSAYNGRISQDMLCARETGANTCHTDSGAPLVSLKDGVWWLVGDRIWGDHCAEQNKPGVYGNVTHFLDWIHYQMKKHQDD